MVSVKSWVNPYLRDGLSAEMLKSLFCHWMSCEENDSSLSVLCTKYWGCGYYDLGLFFRNRAWCLWSIERTSPCCSIQTHLVVFKRKVDSATVHKTKYIRTCISEFGVVYLNWLAKYLYLNPIELLLDEL